MKKEYGFWIVFLLVGIILILCLSACTIGTTNKIITNQYPCETDSTGKNIINFYLDKKQTK